MAEATCSGIAAAIGDASREMSYPQQSYDPWGRDAVNSALTAHDYLVDGRYDSEMACMSY